ncbi:type II secretion system F family protein [bacterium]|jgi:type IV pilus assembly protein PilC|nr:type II secretion system F family protein [bacterium]
MPVFLWRGVDLKGVIHSGKIESASFEDLKRKLYEKNMALSWWSTDIHISAKFVSRSTVTDFFKNLSLLLDSGILVPQAMQILTKQIKNYAFCNALKDIIDDVQSGAPLFKSLRMFPFFFDSVSVYIVQVGQESGSLCNALRSLFVFRRSQENLIRKLKAAALLPTIALCAFVVVATVIFTVVVPMFASMFMSSQYSVPPSTRMIIAISDFLVSGQVFWLFLWLSLVIFFLWIISYLKKIQLYAHRVVLCLPIVSKIVTLRFNIMFLHALSLLVESGVHVVTALHIISDGTLNTAIKNEVYKVTDSVAAGLSLSDQLLRCKYSLFAEDIVSLVHVGQESGRLHELLKQAATLAQENLNRYLSLCVTLFQPIFIFVLGMLIVFLICAIYIPIFNLSQVVM